MILYLANILILLFTGPYTLNAAVYSGTIKAADHSALICYDDQCGEYGRVNFLPTIDDQLTITDSGFSGYAWGDEIGWINFSPTGSGVSIDPVTGVLSGFAYASVGSWINFSPTGQGVRLVDNGSGSTFEGYAYVSGLKGGWMKFDCSSASTCVKTDWRTSGKRRATATYGSNKVAALTAPVMQSPLTTPVTALVNQECRPIFFTSMRLGSKFGEVADLQTFLNAKGFNSGTVDGWFGKLTHGAVQKFQSANTLTADGIVGPMTRAKLNTCN